MADEVYLGIGRRKSSVARIRLRFGAGRILVNRFPVDEYFRRETSRMTVRQPLVTIDKTATFDIDVSVRGGGPNGQAGAIRLGITNALIAFDEALRPPLRKSGFVTRDAREVERKKVGLHKARKAQQFSKR